MPPRRKARLKTRELPDGETLLLTPDGSMALVLNAMGSVVWRLCDGRRTAPEIAAFIVRELPDAPAEDVLDDVEDLLAKLAEAGLVEETPWAAADSEP